ncbi:hypothetical protein [uncultured Marinobacter sp.]|uniref:hypothetical protein n=1 Tax=uncultured Marinobacter sp. TaxID=187379 RepID=UPI00260317E2|nr:hypothetical protein [uncultured Marinobacter sp.]
MKRWLISTCIVGLLMATSPAMADHGHGLPPGIQKQMERGKAMPPGLQKKFLSANYREHRKHHHKDHDYRDRYKYRDRRDYRGGYHDRYRSGYRDSYQGYDDHIPTEHRVVRIIRDAQVLIDSNRR